MRAEHTGRAVRVIRAVGAAAMAVASFQAGAAIDSWIRIPGIPGESVNIDHRGEIDVSNYALTLDTRTCTVAVRKGLDSASPPLAEAAIRRTTLPSVVLTARKAGEGQKDFYTVTLTNASVSSVLASYTSGDNAPTEDVTFSARSLALSYKPQDAKGGLGAAITSTFSCANGNN